ncbi:MAG: ribosome silencing factor [Planctomycetota bacterium]|jgi:ribosome-associated protein|nr:ribosome silencing factor [Planctomycetaceae bacterium]MCE2814889.1 ribosome silencing factor [Planctomycetaceae bacterium]
MSTVNSDPTTLANNAQTVADSIESAKVAARIAAENKGQDIVLLDLSQQTSIFDCFLIVTGTSRRQLHAIAEEIDRELKQRGETRITMSGYDESQWIAIDYGGIIVHLFDQEHRQYYDLEGLWGDARRVDLEAVLTATGARPSNRN